ncbi:MAG: hypothetical protein ACOVP4_14570 [Bacteriovoracaceae bacterium]
MSKWLMQSQSLIIVVMMIIGIVVHRRRSLHVKIMSSVIIWDILLILQVELGRKAIMKASQAMTNPALLNIHVSIAVSTVLLYIVMVITGRKVLAGQSELLPQHKRIGYITFVMRLLTFATSFFAVVPDEAV